MTSPLAMNHMGHLFCPLAMNSFGHIVCDGVEPTPDEKDILSGGGRGGKDFKGWLVPPTVDLTPEVLKEAINSETESRQSETEDAVVEYEVPTHRNKAQPILGGKSLEEFDSDLDRLLATELRIAEIRRHSEMEAAYAEELKQLEEELAVLLLTATL